MIVAISFFSWESSPKRVGFTQRRQEKRKAQRKSLKTQWLQRPGRRAFEEPAGSHSQTMMPGRQPGGVHCETRLTGERTADYLARREHGGVFGPQADSLSEFNETFGLQRIAGDECAHVASAQTRLLERELGSARQGRRHVRIKCHIAEPEHIRVTAHLQRVLDQDKATPIFLDLKTLGQRTHPNSRNPHHSGSLNFTLRLVLFEGD